MFYYIIQFILFRIWIGPIIKIIFIDSPLEIIDGTVEDIQKCCKRFKRERSESKPIR